METRDASVEADLIEDEGEIHIVKEKMAHILKLLKLTGYQDDDNDYDCEDENSDEFDYDCIEN